MLVARIVGFIPFFKKFSGGYSKQSPPPAALRTLWPPQISRATLFRDGAHRLSLIWGKAMQYGVFPDELDCSIRRFADFLLSLGLWLLTEIA